MRRDSGVSFGRSVPVMPRSSASRSSEDRDARGPHFTDGLRSGVGTSQTSVVLHTFGWKHVPRGSLERSASYTHHVSNSFGSTRFTIGRQAGLTGLAFGAVLVLSHTCILAILVAAHLYFSRF